MTFRPVKSEIAAQPTMEGAGVHLYRAFGFHNPREADPFLLFDDFRNDDPAKYHKGFPWHPHRGIEYSVLDSQLCILIAYYDPVLRDGRGGQMQAHHHFAIDLFSTASARPLIRYQYA